MAPEPASSLRRIQRIGPLQLGKVLGILYGLMGLIAIPFALLASMVSTQLPSDQRALAMGFGLGFALVLPFLYAAIGFITGVVGAFLYNLVAKWTGGIEIEVS